MEIHTWRNIFFFEGLFTMIVGLAAPFAMPTSPSECWFLTERERRIAHLRLVSKTGAAENEKTEIRHVKRAVFNITNYICALGFFFINITVQGISLFMPTILKDLGWTATKAQLYSVPPYVCACLIAIAIAFAVPVAVVTAPVDVQELRELPSNAVQAMDLDAVWVAQGADRLVLAEVDTDVLAVIPDNQVPTLRFGGSA